RCRSGKELSSLHETLCFARAYPDNQAVLDLVQDLVDRWERRADVHALRKVLQGLGMAGVAHAYPFFLAPARWVSQPWPGALHVDWDNLEDADGVASLLKLLMPRAESPALEELPLTARQWVRHLKRHLPRASLRRGEHGRALARGRLRFARSALRARPGARH